MERQTETIRQPFTDKQLAEMKEELVQAVGDVKNLRTEKTTTMSTLGAAIKQAEARVFELQAKVSLGYELIDVEIIEALDDPEPGKKKIIRADTSETLRIELMTPRDRQRDFGFGGISGEDLRPEK